MINDVYEDLKLESGVCAVQTNNENETTAGKNQNRKKSRLGGLVLDEANSTLHAEETLDADYVAAQFDRAIDTMRCM